MDTRQALLDASKWAEQWVTESDIVDWLAHYRLAGTGEYVHARVLANRLQGWGRRVPDGALEIAVVCLLADNGNPAWSGDATACVAQVIKRERERIELTESDRRSLEQDLETWGHQDCSHCDAVLRFRRRVVAIDPE